MTGVPQRPLLFLDVDGPLIPFGPGDHPAYRPAPSPHAGSNPLLARIDPAHGPRLRALPCELVWATTWMDDANECVAPILGLPRLPMVSWPHDPAAEERDQRHGLHWKTRALVAWAAGRPFAWVDDEITGRDRAWVAARHPGPALAHRVDPGRGITNADYRALGEWLRAAVG
ncbi:HAD domain-containing protein [Actinomadura sp. WMMA1423]|uniref:HAD domain-containing protein n=1 Tax=Actinomadura sp. WMMA1423 TaxID=2591108 RepID=UPI001147720B|nr:HAD domain-containing protein [Actinomadura sp. WMMA1423]